MSVRVLDGVRRAGRPAVLDLMPHQTGGGGAAMAAVMNPLPTFGASLDGLRRLLPALPTAETVMAAPAEAATTAGHSLRLPYAWAGLALTPVIAAASVYTAGHLLTHVPAASAIERLPVSHPATVTPQSVPAVATPAPTPAPAIVGGINVNQPLQQILNQFVQGQPATYGLYVKNLATGELAVSSPDYVFRSASFYKLFVANAILRRVDAGSLSLAGGAGNGSGESINQCLNLMITISDNTCGDALGLLAGWNTITTENQAQGYSATNLNQPMVTTPRDVATLFERLYAGSLLSPASNNLFMNLLKAQRVNNRLPQGLPTGTVIAHKTGDLYGFMHDGGIVYGPKSNYLVVVMGSPGATAAQFARLSSILYAHFEQ